MMIRSLTTALVGTILVTATAGTHEARAQEGAKRSCALVDRPAAIAESVQADLPEVARLLQITGTASVRVDLTPAGDVADATLATSSGFAPLDREALRVARATRYAPARVGCSATGGSYRLDVDFS